MEVVRQGMSPWKILVVTNPPRRAHAPRALQGTGAAGELEEGLFHILTSSLHSGRVPRPNTAQLKHYRLRSLGRDLVKAEQHATQLKRAIRQI